MKYLKIAFTFLFILHATKALCCTIKLPRLIVKDPQLSPVELEFIHNCEASYVEKLRNFICQNTGSFSADAIARYTDIPASNIQLEQNLKVYNLNDFLNEHYTIGQNKSFMGSSFIGPKKYLSLSNEHEVKVVCDNCERSLGEKNIKLVRNNQNTEQNVWLKTTLAFEVEAFFPTKILHPTSEVLTQSTFVKKSTHTTHPQNLITDIDRIKFLQLRRVLDPNRPINKSDFIKQNLIIAGKHAQVIFKSNGINLSLKALPLSYGKFGDSVRLRNPKSNKIIIGKVIDYNTVLVEL